MQRQRAAATGWVEGDVRAGGDGTLMVVRADGRAEVGNAGLVDVGRRLVGAAAVATATARAVGELVGSGANVTRAAGATGMLNAAAGSAWEAPGSRFMCRATTAPPATAAEAARPPITRPNVMGPVCQM
jgi:hypothetical protein